MFTQSKETAPPKPPTPTSARASAPSSVSAPSSALQNKRPRILKRKADDKPQDTGTSGLSLSSILGGMDVPRKPQLPSSSSTSPHGQTNAPPPFSSSQYRPMGGGGGGDAYPFAGNNNNSYPFGGGRDSFGRGRDSFGGGRGGFGRDRDGGYGGRDRDGDGGYGGGYGGQPARPEWFVTESVELDESLTKCRLSPRDISTIQQQTLERLGAIDPMLRHILEVKVVINQRRNFINMTIKKEYMGLCHYDRIREVCYCYFISDKLEPFVIVTAVDPKLGRLAQLTRSQVTDLETSLENFRNKFNIEGETYHYTGLDERRETDRFVASGSATSNNKAHSSHFHLKVRVPVQMLMEKMPIYGLLNLSHLQEAVEPVKYNFSRDTVPWSQIRNNIINDASPG